MAAIVVSDESHVTDVVITRCVLFEYAPVAVSRIVVDGAILVSAGVMEMEVSVAGVDGFDPLSVGLEHPWIRSMVTITGSSSVPLILARLRSDLDSICAPFFLWEK